MQSEAVILPTITLMSPPSSPWLGLRLHTSNIHPLTQKSHTVISVLSQNDGTLAPWSDKNILSANHSFIPASMTSACQIGNMMWSICSRSVCSSCCKHGENTLSGASAGLLQDPFLNQLYGIILKEHDVHRKENFKEAGDSMHRKWVLRHRKCGSAGMLKGRPGGGTQVRNDGFL